VNTPRCPLRRDALWLGLALLAVLAWELAGADRALSAWAGGAAGFPLRHPGTWASALHEAGRVLGGLMLLALFVDAAWPAPPWRAPAAVLGVARRRLVAAATVATLLLVPALALLAYLALRWDVVDHGGTVPWVSHWALGVADGGPGHCFPSGHASAHFFFAFVALREHRRIGLGARWLLAAVGALGLLFGAVQVVRGAHYLSHVLWSGWLCAALAVAVAAALRLQAGFSLPRPSAAARVGPSPAPDAHPVHSRTRSPP